MPNLSTISGRAAAGPRGRGRRARHLAVAAACGLTVAVAALPTAGPAQPDAAVADLCDDAARHAADRSGVPLDVLRAITRTETGRGTASGLQPWPWTVNMEGQGKWFATRDEARAFAYRHFKSGARSFDIGCFQINYKWHGDAFRSLDDMFDPVRNAGYAAGFLTRLYRELGDWSAAAGAYHSRTPIHANRYTARFERIRSGLGPLAGPARRVAGAHDGAAAGASGRPGATGPLIGRGTATLGSLVPLAMPGTGAAPALIALRP